MPSADRPSAGSASCDGLSRRTSLAGLGAVGAAEAAGVDTVISVFRV